MYYKVSEFGHQTDLGLNSILIVNSVLISVNLFFFLKMSAKVLFTLENCSNN